MARWRDVVQFSYDCSHRDYEWYALAECGFYNRIWLADENKPLDDVEVAVYRHRSRIICGVFAIAISILLLINEIEMASCIAVSILAASVMLVLGETRNRYVVSENYSRL